MTKAEAIERLHNLQSLEEDNITACIGVWYKGIKDDYDEALDIAIEALEKQVPKNPVGATDRNEMWIEGALLCPDCNTYFGEVFDEGYCRKCGRKLIQKRVRVIGRGDKNG